jgi:cell division protein FtsZ
MGTGFGCGENRAVEAAQEAISSPLLDNVTINGAAGVLINITGGMDLTIDEVTTIASIIQEAAGDEAEIIFGAVHDPALEGEVRVTAIATGLEQEEPMPQNVLRPTFGSQVKAARAAQPMQPALAMSGASTDSGFITAPRPMRAQAAPQQTYQEATPFQRMPQAPIGRQQLTDLDIPTFIRRQMD